MAKEVLPSELMQSVMGKLYNVLVNGDESVPGSDDNFFSWCTPGYPITTEDLEFLTQGLTGAVKKQAVAALAGGDEGEEPEKPTQEQIDQIVATDSGRMYMQAENFARLVDFVPDVSGLNLPLSRMKVNAMEGSLSSVYEFILRFSQVMASELPAETKKKIEKFRKLLVTTKTKVDLITDESVEVVEPSPMVVAYNQKMQAYLDAVIEYHTYRVEALAGKDPKAVHFWAMNANALRKKVIAAKNDWINSGYKEDYEKISAYIEQVMSRDMSMLKQQYKDDLDKARLTGLASGSDFFFTSLVPGNFHKGGWTKFSFNSSSYQYGSNSSSNKWGVAGGLSLGIFNFGASASGQNSRYESKFNLDTFKLSFEMCEVPIVRPWMNTAFLKSKAWRFDESNPDAKGMMLSDGGNPPKRDSLLPALPTSALFVRNLVLDFGHADGFSQYVSSAVKGGGFVGWGPFAIGGSYSHQNSSSKFEHNTQGQGLAIDGMQIIGFRCHLLPKSPNPSPNIKEWV